jgi:hypothetical protein
MLTPFPSATALALALGVRLTLRGSTLRRNPWTFGVRVSHPHLRYSCQHSHFRCLHKRSRACFTGLRNAPLPLRRTEDGRQTTDCSKLVGSELVGKALHHPRDRLILVAPPPPASVHQCSRDQGYSAAIPLISSDEPMAIRRKRRNSAFDPF